mmetsp:Transcript_10638/g.12542  ORF Transcript_10638/g.12542 Transcript_10638/m.12542 type:complete len:84 (+) Transcript_10638:1440-1691(+)
MKMTMAAAGKTTATKSTTTMLQKPYRTIVINAPDDAWKYNVEVRNVQPKQCVGKKNWKMFPNGFMPGNHKNTKFEKEIIFVFL